MSPYLSVIITAYNEEDNLNRGVLSVLVDYLKNQTFTWEIILVNDGSTDSTLQLLTQFAKRHQNIKVIDNPHMGKAMGIMTGALAATGEISIFTDMDQATPITETDKILNHLQSGYDIVIGSRSGREGAPIFRQILAFGMVILRGLILRLPFSDTQCGFKGYKTVFGKKIFTIMKSLRPPKVITGPAVDPGFDVEFLYLARKFGLKVAEVPVSWRYQESRRVRFIQDAISGITGLLLVRLRSLTHTYKL
jgi:glycosyltransferase involved in cell wall biosynthesis